ncbi:MAG: alpha/beta hydrolase, partial [Ignavibacteriaceae bacterium]|nr:alpha/beta hydrolase [Ignavibacteriaceae bacterium]
FKAFSKAKEPVNYKTIIIQDTICARWLKPNGGSMEYLNKLKMPTLVITGDEDEVVPWKNSEMISDSIQNSTLIRMDKGGHGLMYQYPKVMGNYILTFFEQKQ